MIDTLFDGFIGAVVAATVAVIVLMVSLKAQGKAVTDQLDKQAEQHAEQLEAQRRENAVNRVNGICAELFGAMTQIPAYRSNRGNRQEVESAAFVSCYRLRLDMSDEENDSFGDLLHEWIFHLCFSPMDEFLEPGEETTTNGSVSFNRQLGWVMQTIHEWLRAGGTKRPEITEDLRKSYRMSKDNGPSAWRGIYTPKTKSD